MLTGFALTFLSLLFVILTMLGFYGNILLLLLAALYGIHDNFVHMTANTLVWMLILYAIGEIWEFAIGFLGIRKEKISYSKVIVIGIGSIIGSVIGTAIFPILGSIIGAAVGAFIVAYIVELLSGSDRSRAWRIAYVAASMKMFALAGKTVIACIMFILFIANISWN